MEQHPEPERPASPPPLPEDGNLDPVEQCGQPASADEADLAVLYGAAGAHALECLRLAGEHRGDPAFFLKCTAMAVRMIREARAVHALLTQPEATRRKPDADAVSVDPPAHAGEPGVQDPGRPEATPAAHASAMASQADRYALEHRKRARLIRSLGRLPQRLDWGPLAPELVRAIATGTSAILRSLDQPPCARAPG